MIKENLTKKDILFRIGHFRNIKNITAYRLSVELGHSKSYFYRVEGGEMQLSIETLLEALDILGVTTSEFFCPTLDPKDLVLLEKINKLSDANKQTVLDIIDKITK